jgi:trk system potassium uptake protein TrkA
MSKQIAVIGLGRLGESLCLELMRQGAEVFAIDTNEDVINHISPHVTQAVIADTTNEAVVEELGISRFDSVFVSIGDDTKASILTTLILKEAGAKNIWVKSKDKYHEKILRKIGADMVLNPERVMGKRVSRHLLTNLFFDYFEVGEGFTVCEVEISESNGGRVFDPARLFAKHAVHLLAVKRGNALNKIESATYVAMPGDIIVLGGEDRFVQKFLQTI